MELPHTMFALRGLGAHLQARGWTGYELAKRAHIPLQVAYRLLDGATKKPSFEMVALVAYALGLSLDDLARNTWPAPDTPRVTPADLAAVAQIAEQAVRIGAEDTARREKLAALMRHNVQQQA